MLHFSFVVNKTRNTIARPAAGGRHDAVASNAADATAIRPWNARSIALSVLLGTHPPELPARALVAIAELFGISGGTMRTALSRLVTAGEVVAVDGRYRLADRLIERQDAQDAGRRPPMTEWDGAWHTVVAVDDQRDASQRRRFRSAMANRRFGELRPDIWTRPSNLGPPPTAPDWLVTTGTLDGIGPQRLVARLWDLDAIAESANRLRSEMTSRRATADWDDHGAIPDLFTTSAAVVRFLRNEPLLPVELTPDAWPVDVVRRMYDEFEADHQRLLQDFLRRA